MTTMLTTDPWEDDHLHEECGVFGVYGADGAAALVALIPIIQFAAGEIPIFGVAWINFAYLLGFLLAVACLAQSFRLP